MKTGNKNVFFLSGMILVMGMFTAGCSTTALQRSENTRTTMQTVEADILKANKQIDITRISLENLISPGQTDAKKAFEAYKANAAKMEVLGKRYLEHADKLGKQGKEYFEEWRKQGSSYTNERIQDLSEQRRAELNRVFAKINEVGIGVKGALKTYMTDIREIREFLSNDLTPKGIDAITPISRRTIKDGEEVKKSVKPVLHAIITARKELVHNEAE